MNIPDILKENKLRHNIVSGFYSPVTGEGSLIERFPFKISEDVTLQLPVAMKDIPLVKAAMGYDSLTEFLMDAHKELKVHSRPKYITKEIRKFYKLRLAYDFEFWAYTCGRIQDKEGEIIRFVLNYPQRHLLMVLEDMRLRGVPIRVVLLKARQWGGSTLVQLYQAWLMLFVVKGYSSAVVTSVEAQAKHIRGMFTRMAEEHPAEVMDVSLVPYEGSKNKKIKGRKNIIGVGSFEEPENLRSFTFQLLHLSECASWKETLLRKPESFVQAIRSTVPLKENTCIVLESTAKGVGNFFHKEWLAAKEGRSGYAPVFIPWFWIDQYQIKIKDVNAFIKGMTERDWELWSLGATLEGINWYNTFKTGENYDDWQMEEEYPSTAESAFQSSGQRIFPLKYTLKMRDHCCPPEIIGELSGAAMTGPESLNRIGIEKNPFGNLHIWSMPDWDGPPIKNRYIVSVDIGGASKKADKSVMRVIDRYWMLEGGKPEFVATWRGNIDQDILAWKAAQLAKWYNNALLIVEKNSLDKENDGKGQFFTILDEIADHYSNLFYTTDPDKIREGVPVKYGFHTNKDTKPMIINALKAALRDELYIERDSRAVDEMDTYETKPDKTMGAVDGSFDDVLIASAIDVWCVFSYLDPPVIAVKETQKRKSIISEASI
jgi:hypothetical protein